MAGIIAAQTKRDDENTTLWVVIKRLVQSSRYHVQLTVCRPRDTEPAPSSWGISNQSTQCVRCRRIAISNTVNVERMAVVTGRRLDVRKRSRAGRNAASRWKRQASSSGNSRAATAPPNDTWRLFKHCSLTSCPSQTAAAMDPNEVFVTDRKKFDPDLELLIDTAAAAVPSSSSSHAASRNTARTSPPLFADPGRRKRSAEQPLVSKRPKVDICIDSETPVPVSQVQGAGANNTRWDLGTMAMRPGTPFATPRIDSGTPARTILHTSSSLLSAALSVLSMSTATYPETHHPHAHPTFAAARE